MTQVLWSVPCREEVQMEILAPGFKLAQTWLVEGEPRDRRSLPSPPHSIILTFK